MKVKIGDTIHDSEEEPIMLILEDNDKRNIGNMSPEAHKFGSYPESCTKEDMKEFMKTDQKMKTIYLAGAGWAFDYRKECKDKYRKDFELIDPIANSDDLFEAIGYNMTVSEIFDKEAKTKKDCIPMDVREEIVADDKRCIIRSDYVVAFVEQPTFGTVMEIHFANTLKLPVFVINPELKLIDDVWLSVHTTMFFENVDECFTYIKSLKEQQ